MAEDAPTPKPGISARIVGLATLVAAMVAGLAAFSTNVLSIRSSLTGLFATPAVPPPELALRDVRGMTTEARGPDAEAFVEMVMDKKGGPVTDCWAQLLMRPPETFRSGSSDKETIGLGDNGKQQIALGLHFFFPNKQAKVRMLCGFSIVTPWVSFEMADLVESIRPRQSRRPSDGR